MIFPFSVFTHPAKMGVLLQHSRIPTNDQSNNQTSKLCSWLMLQCKVYEKLSLPPLSLSLTRSLTFSLYFFISCYFPLLAVPYWSIDFPIHRRGLACWEFVAPPFSVSCRKKALLLHSFADIWYALIQTNVREVCFCLISSTSQITTTRNAF